MTIVPEAQQLVILLLGGTITDKLAWRSTSEPGKFRLLTPSGYIHIHKVESNPPLYGFEAYDDGGEMLTEPFQANEQDFSSLAELYGLAASKVRQRGIGKLIQELHDVIEGKGRSRSVSGASASAGSASGASASGVGSASAGPPTDVGSGPVSVKVGPASVTFFHPGSPDKK